MEIISIISKYSSTVIGLHRQIDDCLFLDTIPLRVYSKKKKNYSTNRDYILKVFILYSCMVRCNETTRE